MYFFCSSVFVALRESVHLSHRQLDCGRDRMPLQVPNHDNYVTAGWTISGFPSIERQRQTASSRKDSEASGYESQKG